MCGWVRACMHACVCMCMLCNRNKLGSIVVLFSTPHTHTCTSVRERGCTYVHACVCLCVGLAAAGGRLVPLVTS